LQKICTFWCHLHNLLLVLRGWVWEAKPPLPPTPAVRKIQKNPISWKNKKKKNKKSFFIFLYKECSIFISFWSAPLFLQSKKEGGGLGSGFRFAEKPPLPPDLPGRSPGKRSSPLTPAVRKNRKTL
jgi:hypothetical protein